ncbi:SDR family oxidoreductase [Secundilactobacillus collinoides]|uniref:Short-chain dehydrogenase n=1 Tax=Secundilactobacillus collinoides TaxID=33960 RepID=A0A161XXA4_SECCO|nr:SDR family oxidoreductase [Secundilactobacillus collinoides]KZL43188.1 short-chain dehydrogenase [Secundilactobacillus collinoides]
MKVFVIGANGHVGRLVVQQLAASDHEVVAGIRHPDQALFFEDLGVPTAMFDLLSRPEQLGVTLDGFDAVIFAAGSGGKTGADMTLLVDLDGAVKSMQAAEIAGIKRYVLVSALFADNRNQWSEDIQPYYAAKFYADDWLRHRTTLAYTILEPGALTFDKGIGAINTAGIARGTIAREDVARAAVASLTTPETIGKTVPMITGTIPINVALSRF